MWWRTYLDVLVNLSFEINFSTKLTCLILLVSSRLLFMIVPVRESIVCACFCIKFLFFFESVAFTHITACAEQEFSFRIIATSSKYLNTSFVNILRVMLFIFLQNRFWSVKNKPTGKRIDAEIQGTLKQAPVRNRTEEKMSYRLS